MKEFLEPELKIIAFEVEDILTDLESGIPETDPDGLPIV